MRRTALAAVVAALGTLLGATQSFALVDGAFDPGWPGSGRFVFYGDPGHTTKPTGPTVLVAEDQGRIVVGGVAIAGILSFDYWWIGELDANGNFVTTFGANGSGRTDSCQLFALCNGTPALKSILPISGGKYIVLAGTLERTTAQAQASDLGTSAGPFQINDHLGAFDVATSAAALPDGRVLLAGRGHYSSSNTTPRLAVVRLTSALGLDNTFNAGTDNSGVTFAGGNAVQVNASDTDERATAVFVDQAGRILLLGGSSNPNPPYSRLDVARLNADGTIDQTYGSNGSAEFIWPVGTFDVSAVLHQTAILDRAGRLLVALSDSSANAMLVARVTAAGALDQTFGIGGFASVGACAQSASESLAIDSAGRIVVSGYCTVSPYIEFVVIRLRGDNGQLDPSFANSGVGIGFYDVSPATDFGEAIVFDSAGRLVVAGAHSAGSDPQKAGISRLVYDLVYTNNFEDTPRGCVPPNCD